MGDVVYFREKGSVQEFRNFSCILDRNEDNIGVWPGSLVLSLQELFTT